MLVNTLMTIYRSMLTCSRVVVSQASAKCESCRSHVMVRAPAWRAGGGCTTLSRGGNVAVDLHALDPRL